MRLRQIVGFGILVLMASSVSAFADVPEIHVDSRGIAINGDAAIAVYKLLVGVKAENVAGDKNMFMKTGPGIQCIALNSATEPTQVQCAMNINQDGSVTAF